MNGDGFDDFRDHMGEPGEVRYLPMTYVDKVGWISKDYPRVPSLRRMVVTRYSKVLVTAASITGPCSQCETLTRRIAVLEQALDDAYLDSCPSHREISETCPHCLWSDGMRVLEHPDG